MPVAPAVRAVATLSATNRAAPRAEFVEPLRSLLATITGARVGLDTVPSSAFSPFTPE